MEALSSIIEECRSLEQESAVRDETLLSEAETNPLKGMELEPTTSTRTYPPAQTPQTPRPQTPAQQNLSNILAETPSNFVTPMDIPTPHSPQVLQTPIPIPSPNPRRVEREVNFRWRNRQGRGARRRHQMRRYQGLTDRQYGLIGDAIFQAAMKDNAMGPWNRFRRNRRH